MGDRDNADLSPGLNDPFPFTPESHPSLQPSDMALLDKLNPGQLRAVASWMRAIASTYDPQAPPEVGHSFRAQASRLDQLARQAQPDTDALVGTLMSSTTAYWMTATGQYWQQALGQDSGDDLGKADAPATACSEAAFRQAYLNPDFTVLLGAERLAQCFGTRP